MSCPRDPLKQSSDHLPNSCKKASDTVASPALDSEGAVSEQP